MLTLTSLLLLFDANISPEANKNIIWNFDLRVTYFFLCECSSSTLYINCIGLVTDFILSDSCKVVN